MKVKTNLSANELELVSKGLNKLAKNQRTDGKFVAANAAESELIKQFDSVFDEMIANLEEELSNKE